MIRTPSSPIARVTVPRRSSAATTRVAVPGVDTYTKLARDGGTMAPVAVNRRVSRSRSATTMDTRSSSSAVALNEASAPTIAIPLTANGAATRCSAVATGAAARA